MRHSLLAVMVILAAGAPAPAQLFGGNPAVAVVNGEAIPRTALDDLLKQRPPVVTPLTAAQQRQMKEELVAALVDECLVRQFLKKYAPPIDPAEVGRQVAALQ